MHKRELYQKLNLGQAAPADDSSHLSDLVNYSQTENISVRNVLLHQQNLKSLFIKLLGIGLITGIFAAMAVVVTIQKFGLTEKINQTDDSQLPRQVEGLQTEDKFLDGTNGKLFKL